MLKLFYTYFGKAEIWPKHPDTEKPGLPEARYKKKSWAYLKPEKLTSNSILGLLYYHSDLGNGVRAIDKTMAVFQHVWNDDSLNPIVIESIELDFKCLLPFHVSTL